jgi:hypothetical protein
MMGLRALPLPVVPRIDVRRRRAEDSVRSGWASRISSRLRFGVLMAFGLGTSWVEGEVRLMSSMPPVLEGVALRRVVGGFGMMATKFDLREWGL